MKLGKLAIVTGAFVAQTISGLVFADDGADRTPYVAPACNITIVQPDNAAGFYWSKDCKTLYVLPPLNGTVEVTSFNNQSLTMKLCPGLTSAIEQQILLKQDEKKYTSAIQQAQPGDPRIDKYQKQLRAEQDLEKDLLKEYDNIYGGSATLLYKVGQSQDWINQYFLKNMNTAIEHQINFQPAPIKESYISFFAKSPSYDMGQLSPVIRAGIPGITPPAKKASDIEVSSAVMMNGAIQAELDLSLMGACPSTTDKDWKDSKLTAYLASNLTYTVPLKTWAGYTATLKSETAIRNLVSSWQGKSQFSINDASTMVSEGSAGVAFEFNVIGEESNPGHFSEDAQKDFFKQLHDETLTRLTARLMEQMITAGFLQMAEAAPTAAAPQPGYIDEIRNGRSCSSSSVFGIKIGGGCSDFQYTVKVPYSTSADTFLKKINDTVFNNSESVKIEDFIYRVHSSAFVPPTKN